IRLTLHIQLAVNEFRTFVHAGQTVVSIAFAGIKDSGGNAFSIVTDAYAKVPSTVSDLYFDSACIGVSEGITQCLPCDAIHIVSQDGNKIPRNALHMYQ